MSIVITISGVPRSGKSTVVKYLIEGYEKLGYDVELIETGCEFRRRSEQAYKQMHPEKQNVNQADIQADPEFAKVRSVIDSTIDGWVQEIGERIKTEGKENKVYIVDSRLAWKNIPDSFAVRLTVDEEIAGERALKDKSKGPNDSYDSKEEATRKTKERMLGEIARYKERYGVDLTDPNNYDFIADTSYVDPEELARWIMQGEIAHREGKNFPKLWASPAYFTSNQGGRLIRNSNVNALVTDIRENGFKPLEGEVAVAQVGEAICLIDGNHRCSAILMAGQTVVPYKVCYKDSDMARLAFEEATYRNYEALYDWPEFLRYCAKIRRN